jgi:hypothetical protein
MQEANGMQRTAMNSELRPMKSPVVRSRPRIFAGFQRIATAAGIAAAACGPTHAAPPASDPLQGRLLAMTQELADALAPADKRVWDQYADPNLLFVSEDNEVSDKTGFLSELKPLPPGFGGTILVTDFQLRHVGDVAVTTYELAEAEWVEGHLIHDRFRETDTWHETPDGWRLLSAHVMAVNKDPPSITMPLAELQQYAGHYVFSPATSEIIRMEAGHLIAERVGRPPQILLPEAPDVFFTPGMPRVRQIFQHDQAGKVIGFVKRREGEDLPWRKE